MVFLSGPINIQAGNTASFAVEFLDSDGAITTPSTTNMTITYTDTSYASATETIDLTAENSIYTGTWSSTSAALGLATWQVTATGSTEVQATGQIRIIERQGASSL